MSDGHWKATDGSSESLSNTPQGGGDKMEILRVNAPNLMRMEKGEADAGEGRFNYAILPRLQ